MSAVMMGLATVVVSSKSDHMDVVELWRKLSAEARQVGTMLGRTYSQDGTFRFALNDLSNFGSLRAILFAMYELESREFGVVSGDASDTKFAINRAKFDSLLSAGLL